MKNLALEYLMLAFEKLIIFPLNVFLYFFDLIIIIEELNENEKAKIKKRKGINKFVGTLNEEDR